MNGLGRGLKYDLLAAEQIFGDSRHKGGISAEKELMLAILADAIDCIWKYSGAQDGRSMRLCRDARQWLFANDSQETFSFVNVCEALSLEPSYIQRGIVDGIEKRRSPWAEDIDTRKPRLRKMNRNFKSGTRHKVRSRTLKA
jgi:hypothetical protein